MMDTFTDTLTSLSRNRLSRVLMFVLSLGLVTVATIIFVKAATSSASLEPEQGSVSGKASVVGGDSSASAGGYINFGNQSTTGCWLPGAAFCENFESGVSTGPSGDFNSTKMSTSRQNNEYPWSSASSTAMTVPKAAVPSSCRSGINTTPFPPGDTLICNPSSSINSHFGLTSTATHNYGDNSYRITQPFDINGRTGKIVFDADLDVLLYLFGWAQISFTSEPIAVPGYYADNARSSGPKDGILMQFNQKCALQDHTIAPEIRTFSDFRMTNLTVSPTPGHDYYDDCTSAIKTKQGFLNRVEIDISQTKVDIYASDYSTDGVTFSNRRLVDSKTINLPFSRGYVHFGGHNHATLKYSQSDSLFYPGFTVPTWNVEWDNIAFDGPAITPDRDYQVSDNTEFVNDSQVAPPNTLVNTGWHPPDVGASPMTPLTFSNVNISGATTARISLTLTISPYSGVPIPSQKLRYKLNNGPWHSQDFLEGEVWTHTGDYDGGLPSTGPSNPQLSVPLSELVNGTNTVQFATEQMTNAAIANVDLLVR